MKLQTIWYHQRLDTTKAGKRCCLVGQDVLEFVCTSKSRGEEQEEVIQLFECHDFNYLEGPARAPKPEQLIWSRSLARCTCLQFFNLGLGSKGCDELGFWAAATPCYWTAWPLT
eukprot:4866182-Amphidinium_carterae.1